MSKKDLTKGLLLGIALYIIMSQKLFWDVVVGALNLLDRI